MKRTLLRILGGVACAMLGPVAFGADTLSLVTTPVVNSVSVDVKPSIMFLLDDSGSMGWEFMPDAVNGNNNKRCYRNHLYNRVYFDPTRVYQLPVDSTGTAYPAATFTGAWTNGFNPGGTKDLSSKFRAGNDGVDHAAYYYEYTGAGSPVPGTCYGDADYTLVTVAAGQQQNFANWYSYYRTRMLMMKSAVTIAFKGIDQAFRIGYMSINNNTGSDFLNPTIFDSAGKMAWYAKIIAATPSGGTGLRWTLTTAGRLFGGKLTGSTFRGSTVDDPVKHSCQQNLTILSTDGFWNSSATGAGCGSHQGCYLDGTAMGNTDGAPTLRPQLDVYDEPGTLADVAMYYFKTDLRGDKVDNVFHAPSLDDTNSFQHMNTFTIGLGVDGTLKYEYPYKACATCDYPAIVAGTKDWPKPVPDSPTAVDDLWHAAVNGHGLYFGANSPDDVQRGLDAIVASLPKPGAGGAVAVASQVVALGDGAFLGGYNTKEWTGDIKKHTFANEATAELAAAPSWSAQAKLDARVSPSADTREKLYFSRNGALTKFLPANLGPEILKKWFDVGNGNPNGRLNQYPFFSAAQIAAADPVSVINFVRGHRGLEDTSNDIKENTVTKLYRGRTHVLGDIVNSSPAYVQKPAFDYQQNGYSAWAEGRKGRKGAVYAGANDGMLHAFDGETGEELWAFIPTAVMPYLYKLADKTYETDHRPFVDGPLTVGDVYYGGSWKTVVIGGLGRGGRAYFALNVTDPDNPELLWEFSGMDALGLSCEGTASATTCDKDLGFTYGGAIMTKLMGTAETANWVAVFGSGYNNELPYSTGDGAGHLYMVDIQSGAQLAKITTGGGTIAKETGIAWVNGWTDSGMTRNEVRDVYAGDLDGNIWRFDLVGQTVMLLTKLRGGAGNHQPVTTRPELGDFANDVNQRVVYIGTGKYVELTDKNDTDIQSFYAIRDTGNALKSNVGGAGGFRSVAKPLLSSGNRSSVMKYNDVTTDPDGWVLDFDVSTGGGSERVIVHPRIFGPNQSSLMVVTNIPTGEDCDVGGTGYVYFLDSQPNKSYDADMSATVVPVPGAMAVGASIVTTKAGASKGIITRSDGTVVTVGANPPSYGNTVRRVSWRELMN